jgi:transposase
MKRRRYTKEFKEEAVKLVKVQGYSAGEASKNLGINVNNINRWIAELAEDRGANPAKMKLTQEQEEINRLRKENHRLKLEREILKKAAAFFANELQ